MEPQTLEVLRQNSGKSLGEIHSEISEANPQIAPRQRSGIIHWEKQGITDVRVIRALATVYKVDFDIVADAALASRERFILSRTRSEKTVTILGKFP